MNLKLEFIEKSFQKNCNFTELCAEYGISTKTGYKWKERFYRLGVHGLKDQPKIPRSNPGRVTEDAIITIIKLKQKNMNWGAPKIHKLYIESYPEEEYISPSTVQRILKKAGLVEKKKRRRKVNPERLQMRIKPEKPNDVWTVDFKGWWYTTKKEKCEPLTVRDEFSKLILSIKILEKGNISCVKREFERLFKEFGLPKIIRSDNGVPFASSMSLMGLTRLSAWWMSLGVRLDRIDPGSPYQNGGHERMHRDMKKELQGKIAGNLVMHQKIFEKWRQEFNDVRPHGALNMKRPSDVYEKSSRKYNGTVYEIEYPSGYKCRRVNDRGWLHFDGRRIFITNALCGYYLGMKQNGTDSLNVWFGETLIGKLDLKTYLFESILSISGNTQNKTLPMS